MLNVQSCAPPRRRPTLAEQLRQETRPEHEAIERVAAMTRLFADDYSEREYRALLGRLYGFYQALEPVLFGELTAAETAPLARRRKCGWLKQDLHHLGVGVDAQDRLPLCFRLPPAASEASRAGVFYVLEGATMGGQVISRHLVKHFGEQSRVAGALCFYRGYGEHNGRQWRALRDYLERLDNELDALGRAELIAAARSSFVCLSEWLEDVSDRREPASR